MTWTPDRRHKKHFGDYWMVPETNHLRQTAHLLDLGRVRIRVFPDDDHSGQKRSLVVSDTLEQANALVGVSGAVVEAYVVGRLAQAGLTWARVEQTPDLCEWLDEWFCVWGDQPGETLVRDLRKAGWEVVRA